MDRPSSFEGLVDRLLPGEVVLWSGKPLQGFMLTPGDAMLVPFSLAWGGFSIFWEAKAIEAGQAGFILFGIPFVLLGSYSIAGRFLLDIWLRRRIDYALTDRRVLIARAGPWPKFTALAHDRSRDVTLMERSRGRGTIMFGLPVMVPNGEGGYSRSGAWAASLDPTPRFLGIADARRVFALIQECNHRAE